MTETCNTCPYRDTCPTVAEAEEFWLALLEEAGERQAG